MDKVIKVVFALAVLASAASVFYYYAIFLPGIEHERQTKIEADKLSEVRRLAEEKILAEEKAAEKELLRKSNYEYCLSLAETAYEINWQNECKAEFVARCSATVKSIEKSLRFQARLRNETYDVDVMKMCGTDNITDWSSYKLSAERADVVNERLRHDKETCLSRAKADL